MRPFKMTLSRAIIHVRVTAPSGREVIIGALIKRKDPYWSPYCVYTLYPKTGKKRNYQSFDTKKQAMAYIQEELVPYMMKQGQVTSL